MNASPNESEGGPIVRREPVVVLDPDTLSPTATVSPCPSSEVAVLNVERPVRVGCGLEFGHDGDHEFVIRWRCAHESNRIQITPPMHGSVQHE